MNESSIIAYPAIFESEENGAYTVSFPDIDGCLSQGETFEEALINAQEALAIYLHEMAGELNAPSSILEIIKQNSGAIVQMVCVDLSKYKLKKADTKYVRKNLTIPEWLNDLSEKYDVNYSFVLKNALIECLKNDEKVTEWDKIILNS